MNTERVYPWDKVKRSDKLFSGAEILILNCNISKRYTIISVGSVLHITEQLVKSREI